MALGRRLVIASCCWDVRVWSRAVKFPRRRWCSFGGINFKMDVKKVPGAKGGEPAVITLNGKHLPVESF